MSGLKTNMSDGIFVMKAEAIEKVEEYLASEPFKFSGIQYYNVIFYIVNFYIFMGTFDTFRKSYI